MLNMRIPCAATWKTLFLATLLGSLSLANPPSQYLLSPSDKIQMPRVTESDGSDQWNGGTNTGCDTFITEAVDYTGYSVTSLQGYFRDALEMEGFSATFEAHSSLGWPTITKYWGNSGDALNNHGLIAWSPPYQLA